MLIHYITHVSCSCLFNDLHGEETRLFYSSFIANGDFIFCDNILYIIFIAVDILTMHIFNLHYFLHFPKSHFLAIP